MSVQPANKLRRTAIVVSALALCVGGLVYLNLLDKGTITNINERTADNLLSVFQSIMITYVIGSVGGPVLGKFADKNKKDESNAVGDETNWNSGRG